MPVRFALIGVLAASLFAAQFLSREAQAQQSSDLALCGNANVDACTRLIQSGKLDRKKLAISHLNRGNGLNALGQSQQALADFDEAIRLLPNHPFAHNGKGVALSRMGKFSEAIASFDRAIGIDPNYANAHNNRGVADRELGNFDDAIRDFSRAISIDPRRAVALANRGEAWRLKGNMVNSIGDLDRAILLDPRAQLFFSKRGDTWRYIGEFERALKDYDTALNIAEDYPGAFVGRGLTFERMGLLDRARSDLTRSLTFFEPDNYNRSAQETARARLVAFDAGIAQPIIPNVARESASNSIPTPKIALPEPRSKSIAQGRRVALVIGNSAYKTVPSLTNPEKDADAVAASLRNIGFEVVTLLTDATRERLVDALRGFGDQAEQAEWAMVYYAGHGIEVNGQNYLIPVDAKLKADRDIQFEAVPLDQVMASVEGAKKLKLVVLDACRDNPFSPQMRKSVAPDAVVAVPTEGGKLGSRSIGRGLGEVKVQGATLVVYAAKHGQTALDGEGGNSPFAVAMVQRIATPGVEINKIFRLVRDDVMEATAGRQEPYTYGSLPGKEDFFFVATH